MEGLYQVAYLRPSYAENETWMKFTNHPKEEGSVAVW